MSIEIESGGLIAAAVMLPVSAAFGAGWVAWQCGKLIIEGNKFSDRLIAAKKQQLEEAAMHRRRSALATHKQLIDICNQTLSKLTENSANASLKSFAEFEQLKAELNNICNTAVPDDVLQIEKLTSRGYVELEKIITNQQRLLNQQTEDAQTGIYHGHSLSDLMLDLKVALEAMSIHATNGANVKAADPVVLERAKLNEKLAVVAARVVAALERIAYLSSNYGLSLSADTSLKTFFAGVDKQLDMLYSPATSNENLKKGIKKLERTLEQYDMLIPTIESEQMKFATLYPIYVQAANALNEPIASHKSFKNLQELESKLDLLKKRAEKATECAEIYQKLGHTAYICYAWDCELSALGYTVHKRSDIAKMAGYNPQRAMLEDQKLPFYQWNETALTQLYSMTNQCSLQVIVHDDGTVSMQAISDGDENQTQAVRKTHCSLMNKLHENLKKNWFLSYGYEDTSSSNSVPTSQEWFNSDRSAWRTDREKPIIGVREIENTSSKNNNEKTL